MFKVHNLMNKHMLVLHVKTWRFIVAGKFEIAKAKDGQFFFRLKAGNGQVILMSEMYRSKQSCKNGIASVKLNSQEEKQFEKKESVNGKPYFTLKAKNHEIIGVSEMYESTASRDNGIRSVMENAPEANIEDLTAKD